MPHLPPKMRSLSGHSRINERRAARVEKASEINQRGQRNLGSLHHRQRRAALRIGHPLRQERPGSVRQEADEIVVAVRRALTPFRLQRLPNERMPLIVDRH